MRRISDLPDVLGVLARVAIAVMMVAMPACAGADAGNGPSRSHGGPPGLGDGGSAGPLGSPGTPADPEALARAVEETRGIASGRVEVETVYTHLGELDHAPPGVDDVRMVQRAAFDRRAHRAEAEADMSELAAVLDASDERVPGDYTAPTRLVIDGATVYSQVGPLAELVGLHPTTWVRRDLDSFGDQPIDNETAALLLQPLGMLDLLRWRLEGVRAAGREVIRGVATTRVTAVVDLTGPAEPADRTGPSGPPDGREGFRARLHGLGIDRLPLDVWVDDDEIVRRVEFSLDAATGGPARGGLTTRFDVFDVGEPIEVALPDPATVIEQSELAARVRRR